MKTMEALKNVEVDVLSGPMKGSIMYIEDILKHGPLFLENVKHPVEAEGISGANVLDLKALVKPDVITKVLKNIAKKPKNSVIIFSGKDDEFWGRYGAGLQFRHEALRHCVRVRVRDELIPAKGREYLDKQMDLYLLGAGRKPERKINTDRVVEIRPSGLMIELVADRGRKGKEYLVHYEGWAHIAKEKKLEEMVQHLEEKAAYYVLLTIENKE